MFLLQEISDAEFAIYNKNVVSMASKLLLKFRALDSPVECVVTISIKKTYTFEK